MPASLVLTLDNSLKDCIVLDNFLIYIFTGQVIDAKNFRLQIDEHKKSSSFPEAFHQIAFAVTWSSVLSYLYHFVFTTEFGILCADFVVLKFVLLDESQNANNHNNKSVKTFLDQDVVILNKIDLVEGSLEDLERQIHEVNALVTVVQSVRCQVDLNKIFDQQAYGAKVST